MYNDLNNNNKEDLKEAFDMLYQLSGEYGMQNDDQRIQWVMACLIKFF